MSVVIPNLRGAIAVPGWAKNELWRKARAVPSLDLRFADSKSLVDSRTGQNLVTFNRASSGTFVGSDGALATASTDIPRFDHNPITGESLGLLVEEQRTNLLPRSEEFGDPNWIKSQATVTSNSIVSPAGTVSADTIVEDTANAVHVALQNYTFTAAAHTYSIFVKAAGRSFVRLVAFDGTTAFAAYFNLSTGAVGTLTGAVTASSVAYNNAWYRCSITFTSAAGAGNTAIRLATANGTDSYTGNGSSGVYIWGAQLEAGAFPTSYIPTTTAAATRSADVASITGTNFSGWYRQDEGAMFAEGAILNTAGNRFMVAASDATVNEEIALYWGTVFSSLVTDGGSPQANSFGGAIVANNRTIHSFGYKANDFQGYGNGTALATDTSGTLPTVDRLTIGSRVNTTFWANGTIRRFCFWPTRLANETLQSITQ